MFKHAVVSLILVVSLAIPASAEPRHHFFHRIWDKHFWIATIVQTAGMVADVETTMAASHRAGLAEGNPLVGNNPSRAELYAVAGGLEIGVLWCEHTLKKMSEDGSRSNATLYHSLVVIQTGVHTGAAIHNLILLSGSSPAPAVTTKPGVPSGLVFPVSGVVFRPAAQTPAGGYIFHPVGRIQAPKLDFLSQR